MSPLRRRAGHITREQGATVTRGVALTGGWQTSREGVYVQASRATERTDFHIGRDDLDAPEDAEHVEQLAARIGRSNAQTPLDRDLRVRVDRAGAMMGGPTRPQSKPLT